MCCLITILLLLGPRVANIIWWIVDTARWDSVFGLILWPILGIIFLPWTTLAYVLVAPGGLGSLEILLLFAAITVDVVSYAGGGFGNRKRVFG
jgi:hypothetical protein